MKMSDCRAYSVSLCIRVGCNLVLVYKPRDLSQWWLLLFKQKCSRSPGWVSVSFHWKQFDLSPRFFWEGVRKFNGNF